MFKNVQQDGTLTSERIDPPNDLTFTPLSAYEPKLHLKAELCRLILSTCQILSPYVPPRVLMPTVQPLRPVGGFLAAFRVCFIT